MCDKNVIQNYLVVIFLPLDIALSMKTQMEQILYSTPRAALSTNLRSLCMYWWNVGKGCLLLCKLKRMINNSSPAHARYSFTERGYMHA